MPLYDFACQQCHHQFEALVRNGQEPVCPQCQGRQLTRHFGVPAAVVRGGRLPIAAEAPGQPCGAPNCCLGRCQTGP